jgi:hypothetical protein
MGRRPLTICLAVLAFVPASAVAAGFPSSFAPLPHNPADRLAAQPIEDYRYDRAKRCTRSPRSGTVALQGWLSAHAGGESWGIMRCERLSRRNYSLHSEGRAIDWHLDARNPADRRAGRRLIKLLLAPDGAGNPHALARRMGVQEIIWDCRAWWSGAERPMPYSVCYSKRGKPRRHVDATTAHRDHIHIGLNRMGAARLTSFWRSR